MPGGGNTSFMRLVVNYRKIQILFFLLCFLMVWSEEWRIWIVLIPNTQYNILLSKAHLSLILSQINWAVFIQHQASDPAPRSLIHCSVYLAPAPVLQSINDRSWLAWSPTGLTAAWPGPAIISRSQDQSNLPCNSIYSFETLGISINAIQCSIVFVGLNLNQLM